MYLKIKIAKFILHKQQSDIEGQYLLNH